MEDFALFGMFDVVLQPNQTIAAGYVEDLKHHHENIEVVLLCKASPENAGELFYQRLQHCRGGCNNQGAQGCAADDEDFVGLIEGHHFAPVPHETAQNRTDNNYSADKCKHKIILCWTLVLHSQPHQTAIILCFDICGRF